MSLFKVVVADPPWAFNDRLRMSAVKRGAEAHYGTMSVAEIAALPVADWCLADAVLALWVPASLLADGLTVLAGWGFAQKQIYTWVKQTKTGGIAFGMGRQFRGATEHALIGTRGRPKPVSRSQRNVDLFPALPHSRKPSRLQERLEEMYPEGPFLELFARRGRPGWTCVGNESPDSPGADVRQWQPEIRPYAG
jgi:N6-adenosine-specific RNA methylase IME4